MIKLDRFVGLWKAHSAVASRSLLVEVVVDGDSVWLMSATDASGILTGEPRHYRNIARVPQGLRASPFAALAMLNV